MSAPVSTRREALRVLTPDDPQQAVKLARRHRAPYVAGGTWLQPAWERSGQWPAAMVALDSEWHGFRGIRDEPEGLRVGALTTLGELVVHPELALHWPALAGLLWAVAGPGVRQLGTLGGNLLAGGDLAAIGLALEARLEVITAREVEEISLDEWLYHHEPESLVASLLIPHPGGRRLVVEKLGYRERFSPTRVTVACVGDGTTARMAVCGEGGAARLRVTEAALRNRQDACPRDLAAICDSELATLGWACPDLRRAAHGLVVHLLEELGHGG